MIANPFLFFGVNSHDSLFLIHDTVTPYSPSIQKPIATERKCPKCKQVKPNKLFTVSGKSKIGSILYSRYCTECKR